MADYVGGTHNSDGNILLDSYFGSEQSAFIAIKKLYPNHAVTIFKVSLPLDDLHMIDTKVNGIKTYKTFPDLHSYTISMKGMNTGKDSVESLKTADFYKKVNSGDQIIFEKIKYDSEDNYKSRSKLR